MAGNEVQGTHHRAAYQAARGWHAADALKRAALVSALSVAVLAVLVLVVLSPLALRQLGSVRGVNWAQLSNIGQTYGAASALLTGLALVGVAGSMVFQVRAIQVSREQASREHHARLVEMALTDPVYQRCWAYEPAAFGTDRYRQQAYLNLIVSNWENEYVLGGFPEHAMRRAFEGLFRGEAGREFWARTHDIRLETSGNRRQRRFCRIMEGEYQKAIAAGPPAVQAEAPPVPLPASQGHVLHDSAIRTGATLLLGAIGGIALETFLRQRRQ